MELIDNINRLLGDDLKQTIKQRSRLNIAASCFSMYAFEALKAELEKIDELKFIFTSPTFVADEVTDKIRKERREFHIPKVGRERSLYGSEFEIQLRNRLTQRAIAKECAEWMRRKATFKSNRSKAPMQQFACIQSDGGDMAYMPLHGFTAVDLGYQPGNAVSNLVNKMDERQVRRGEQLWQIDGAGEVMAEEDGSPGSNPEPRRKKSLDLSVVLKPVAEMDTSIGRLFLFPLRVSDVGEYEKLSAQLPVGRIRAFLPCIASLSPDYSLDQKRVAITAGQVEQLSDQEVEALAEVYVVSSALRDAREGGKNREPLPRGPEEPAIAFLDRLLSAEIEEQANQSRKMREKILGSTRGIFDQVRKSSMELGETWRRFDQLAKTIAVSKVISPATQTKSLEMGNHIVEHSARIAREAENQLLRNRVEQLTATVTTLENKISANDQGSAQAPVNKK